MHKSLLIILLTLLLTTACTRRFDSVEDNTPVGNMECLWKTLDEKYCYFEEKEIDWKAVYDQYLPSVKELDQKNYLALFDTLSSMINVLKDGHVNLYSSFDVSSCKSWYEGYPVNWDWEVVRDNYLKDYRKAGGAYYTTLSDSIGYMYVSSFESAISPNNMAYMLRSWLDCKGLIVDVRNNGGGNMDYAYQLAATFFKESQVIGYWQHKNGTGHEDFSKLEEQKLDKEAMPSSWFRPVVVLCNRRTFSAANFFVSMMRYATNSCIIGGISGGGGGLPLSYELPNGWLVRFSSVRMYDKDSVSIEPGIKPDIFAVDQEITHTTDEVIETGKLWINSLYKK